MPRFRDGISDPRPNLLQVAVKKRRQDLLFGLQATVAEPGLPVVASPFDRAIAIRPPRDDLLQSCLVPTEIREILSANAKSVS